MAARSQSPLSPDQWRTRARYSDKHSVFRVAKQGAKSGQYVDSYEFPEGRLKFRWEGVLRPYTAFDKDQRVTHAAVTEDKRLGAVLDDIKAQQEKAPPTRRHASKQATPYVPNGRRNAKGWNFNLARPVQPAQDSDT
jgi:hypothetical protein